MSWTTPADLQAQLARLWARGDLLRAAVGHEVVAWPRRLNLKSPAAADLTGRFSEVGAWVAQLTRMPSVRVEWREWMHRVQGRQRLPGAVWVDSLEDALKILGKTADAGRYQALWQHTAAVCPALLPWLLKRPMQVLELADRWDRLLAVAGWMRVNPSPGIYLRQVDVAGVDSKFIEAHRGTLAEWLDLLLPAESVDMSSTGVAGFARRYGFREKPVCIRFRPLDPDLIALPGCTGLPDISLDASSFAALALQAEQVFITENEVNFLAFPPLEKSLVIFGAGYGWQALSAAGWLHRCALHYWGDIDTHGFVILDRLRAHFPHAASFLMDRQTLLAHQAHWGTEAQPARHVLDRLTEEETALYDDLRFDRIRPGLRLEQERVAYGWLEQGLLSDSAGNAS